jgi:hypothetical protein
VEGPWRADFGRDPNEPLGPLAVLRDGMGFAVLDQENRRILRYDRDGGERGAIPIPDRATLDAVALGGSYGLLAYDRESRPPWRLRHVDEQGVLLSTTPLSEAFEAPSGVFSLDGHLLVEDAHGPLCLADRSRCWPGRPDGGGLFVSAEKTGLYEVALAWRHGEGPPSARLRLQADRLVSNVISLDPFVREGEHLVLLALLLYDEGPAPRFEMLDPEIRVLLVDSLGHRRDEQRLAPGDGSDVTRPLCAASDGALFQLRPRASGLAVLRREFHLARRRRP